MCLASWFISSLLERLGIVTLRYHKQYTLRIVWNFKLRHYRVVLRIAEISFLRYGVCHLRTTHMTTKDRSPIQFEEKNEPSQSFLSKIEGATIDAASKLLGIPAKKPKEEKLAKLTPKQEAQLKQIEENAIAEFRGDLTQLEAALGMLRFGHHVGWKVLYLIHSKKTIRNYEDILQVKVRDIFDETGPSSYRSLGFNIAQRFSNFWKVAGGDIKIPRKKDVA
jgi:hypothetical protein